MKEHARNKTPPVNRTPAKTTGKGLSLPAVVPFEKTTEITDETPVQLLTHSLQENSARPFVLQRVISDKDPIEEPDVTWTTEQADRYIINKGLIDKTWPAGVAGPFTKTDEFVKEIIVDEILKCAKAEEGFNAERIVVAAGTKITETLSILNNITNKYASVTSVQDQDQIGEQ